MGWTWISSFFKSIWQDPWELDPSTSGSPRPALDRERGRNGLVSGLDRLLCADGTLPSHWCSARVGRIRDDTFVPSSVRPVSGNAGVRLFPISPEDPFTFLTMAISKPPQGSSGVKTPSPTCALRIVCVHFKGIHRRHEQVSSWSLSSEVKEGLPDPGWRTHPCVFLF